MDRENVYHIKLTNHKGKNWLSTNKFAVKGFAFNRGKLLKGEALAETILESIKQYNLTSLLVNLNGNFSVILQYNEKTYLVADKIRSYPLIYTKQIDNTWFITDSAIGIEENAIVDKILNTLTEAEFLALGYVSGNDTLYQGIYTVDAGEYVVLEADGSYSRKSYFKYIFEKKSFVKETVVKAAFNSLEAAFGRVIKTIQEGCQIVIPLSGGYDSRLIACLCKKYNLSNVVCYTYGRRESFEVATSRRVAKTLGFEWHYVEYTPESLADCVMSDEFKEFSRFTSNCNSIPHVQDFLALQNLKKKEILKEGSIVIPGFCGDLFGGSKVPREIFGWSEKKFSVKGFAELIYNHFYDLNILTKKSKEKIIHRIETEIQDTDVSSEEKFLNNYEQWCIANRLSKYIINSNRVYEFFGLDWRMPLWDYEYAETWYQVQWRNKTSELLEEFMFDNYFNKNDVDERKQKIVNSKNFVLKTIKNCLPKKIKAFLTKLIFLSGSNKDKHDYNSFEGAAEILSKHCPSHDFPEISKTKPRNILAVLSRIELEAYIMNQKY